MMTNATSGRMLVRMGILIFAGLCFSLLVGCPPENNALVAEVSEPPKPVAAPAQTEPVQDEPARQHVDGDEISEQYRPYTLTSVGEAAPEFAFTLLDGTQSSLAELRGEVVVLSFFATWCGPCISEMNLIERDLKADLDALGVTLLYVGREHKAAELESFRKQRGFSGWFAADPNRGIYGKYATKYIPRLYVIDRSGTIRYQTVAFDEGNVEGMMRILREAVEEASVG